MSRPKVRSIGTILALGFLFGGGLDSARAVQTIALKPVATGLTAPNYVTTAGDGSDRLFIVDQAGQVRIVDSSGTLLPTPFLDLSSQIVELGAFGPGSFDERGLLGLAFHPNFAVNGKFYVYYSAKRDPEVHIDFDSSTQSPPFTMQGVQFDGGIVGTQFSPPLYSSGQNAFEIATNALATITFPEPVAKVRFFFVHRATADPGTVRAFDAGGNLLVGPISSRAATFFGDPANFVTIEEGFPVEGIKRLELQAGNGPINGQRVLFVDDLEVFNYNHTGRVSEFMVSLGDPDVADPNSERVVLEIPEPEFNHNSGTVAFGPDDGFLYISVGDGGNAGDLGLRHNPTIGNGQDRTTWLGSILRIDVDGGLPFAVPAGNPFVGDANALDEIWAYGLRNPYRFSFDMGGTHQLFCGDAGQDLFEEVSIITAGQNMGWNIKEGFHCFDPNDFLNPPNACPNVGPSGAPLTDPIIEYAHFEPDLTPVGQVVIGGNVYRGSKFPGLTGKYVFGDFSLPPFGGPADGSIFVGTEILAGVWGRSEPTVSTGTAGRLLKFVLGFGQDHNGEVYVCTNETGTPFGSTGVVSRIVPTKGDINGDGAVNLVDFVTFAGCFGLSAPGPGCDADELEASDVNDDGTVNLADFVTFAQNFTG